MEGAGALEAEAQRVGQARAIAEEHGIEHAGVVRREAEQRRQAAVGRGARVGEQASGGPALRGEDAAVGAGGEVCERCFCGACEQADPGCSDVRGGGDSLGRSLIQQQVVGVLPCVGIAVALGRAQAHGDFDQVAAAELELARDLRLRGVVGQDGGADAAGNRDHARGVGSYVFDGGEREVERERGRAVRFGSGGLVPLVWIGVRVARGGVVALLLRRERSHPDDAALDGAAEAVGIGQQRGLRRGRGLNLR